MLNKIIANILQKSATIDPVQHDEFEFPSHYSGFILPLRYLLAMRYLKHKQAVLEEFREEGIFPPPADAFKTRLISRLTKNGRVARRMPILSSIFSAWFIYPLLISAIIASTWLFQDWTNDQRLKAMLANRLPYYSDLLHRSLMFKYSGYEEAYKKVLVEIEAERKSILAQLPNKKDLLSTIEKGLVGITDKERGAKEIMTDFKAVNIALDQNKLPYYITPKVLTVPCSSLIDAPLDEMLNLKRIEAVLTGGKPEMCNTTMLTVYHVAKRNHLNYKEVELPLFHVRRIDKVPAVDGALGLTFGHQGIGSILLLDRIKEFATDSVIPALTFQGRNTLIPYWLKGYYEVEETISKKYKQSLNDIYQSKAEIKTLKAVAKELLKNKNKIKTSRLRQTLQRADGALDQGVLGGGLDAVSSMLGGGLQGDNDKKPQKEVDLSVLTKLNGALLPSIEVHEAYHQIDKTEWVEPEWVNTVFSGLTENGKEHAMEELGAYLTQLAYTEQGSDIWVTKLLFFSLNAMMRNQPEFYASSLILGTMNQLYAGKPVEITYDLSVNEKIEIYKTLSSADKVYLRVLAERAYIELFRRPVPMMVR